MRIEQWSIYKHLINQKCETTQTDRRPSAPSRSVHKQIAWNWFRCKINANTPPLYASWFVLRKKKRKKKITKYTTIAAVWWSSHLVDLWAMCVCVSIGDVWPTFSDFIYLFWSFIVKKLFSHVFSCFHLSILRIYRDGN